LEIYHLVLDRPPLILFFLLLSDCRDADNRAEIVMSAKVRCGARKQLEPLLVPESVFGLHQLSERYIDWTSKITRAMTSTLRHPLLGSICGRKVTSDLIQYSGIPYASIVQRFARSTTLSNLPTTSSRGTFDATDPGPDSVQPCNATEIDAKGNQFPHSGFKESPQSEDCLSLNITTTSTSSSSGLPVIVFLHGGAFFLGSSTRPYYSPLNLLDRAVQTDHPLVFVSINYRLGALGFLHSSEVPHILPPNNALHDQLRAFDWIHQNIAGFGGDPDRITALGQSAGSMSLALHSISANPNPLFQQIVCLSGSPVTMPSKSPARYDETFSSLAEQLGVQDIPKKNTTELAHEFTHAQLDKIRDLSYVGAPCTSSEILPYEHPSMAMTRAKPTSNVKWLRRAIFSSATYDGGVSYNLLASSRKENGRTFTQHVRKIMSHDGAKQLLALYDIKETDDDSDVLEKICQFESDIGFFFASLAQVDGSPAEKKYFQVFDLKNPFGAGGPLPKDRFATHTWDIVAFLGCYDELLPDEMVAVIQEWRDRILRFMCDGDEPWDEWDETDGKALRVDRDGTRVETRESYLSEDCDRRKRLLELASRENGQDGCDFLWEGVCRTWLDS